MSAAFTPGPTYADNGSFAAAAKFLTGDPGDIEIGPAEYEFQWVYNSGTDGGGSVRHGYRGRRISMRVAYVDSSENNVVSAFNTDMNAIANVSSQLLLNGITFYGCFLEAATHLSRVMPTGHPNLTFYASATIVTNARRLA